MCAFCLEERYTMPACRKVEELAEQFSAHPATFLSSTGSLFPSVVLFQNCTLGSQKCMSALYCRKNTLSKIFVFGSIRQSRPKLYYSVLSFERIRRDEEIWSLGRASRTALILEITLCYFIWLIELERLRPSPR